MRTAQGRTPLCKQHI